MVGHTAPGIFTAFTGVFRVKLSANWPRGVRVFQPRERRAKGYVIEAEQANGRMPISSTTTACSIGTQTGVGDETGNIQIIPNISVPFRHHPSLFFLRRRRCLYAARTSPPPISNLLSPVPKPPKFQSSTLFFHPTSFSLFASLSLFGGVLLLVCVYFAFISLYFSLFCFYFAFILLFCFFAFVPL